MNEHERAYEQLKADLKRIKEVISLVDLCSKILGEEGKTYANCVMFCCPFHEDKNPSLMVREKNFCCYPCNIKGDHFSFVVEYIKVTEGRVISLYESVKIIKQIYKDDYRSKKVSGEERVYIPEARVKKKPNIEEILSSSAAAMCCSIVKDFQEKYVNEANLQMDNVRTGLNSPFISWLKYRKIPFSWSKKYGMGFCKAYSRTASQWKYQHQTLSRMNLCISDSWNDRLFMRMTFPIHGPDGRIFSWWKRCSQGRVKRSKIYCYNSSSWS